MELEQRSGHVRSVVACAELERSRNVLYSSSMFHIRHCSTPTTTILLCNIVKQPAARPPDPIATLECAQCNSPLLSFSVFQLCSSSTVTRSQPHSLQSIVSKAAYVVSSRCVQWSPTGAIVAAGSADQIIMLHGVEEGQDFLRLQVGVGWGESGGALTPNRGQRRVALVETKRRGGALGPHCGR